MITARNLIARKESIVIRPNNETKMDLKANSLQRAFTARCAAEVTEETDKKQVSTH